MLQKSFEKWEIDDLHHAFGLKMHYENFKPLDDWLAISPKINAENRKQLGALSKELSYNANYWNEDELKVFFIGRLLALCNLKSKHYKIFMQRHLKATVNDIELKGIVDFVIAQGISRPEKPFFFLHEYKQEKQHTNDPLAQLLSAMLVAQALNEKKHPIYGCYVLGRFWFFVVLDGTDYGVSNAYNASDEDIYQIVAMMREAQKYILGFLGV